MSNLLTGAEFVLDAPARQTVIWGEGAEIVWSESESLYLTGPMGVGKSTVQQQIIAGRLGLRSEVLGWPIVDDGGPVLLIAADRPAQIQRSMRRMFSENDRAVLESRLRVHRGALPFDIVKHPEKLAEFVGDATTLAIDSLKDIAAPLTSDEVGAAINRALQSVLAKGCQVTVLHHHRKASGENKKPSRLADVYGSVWLTAGAGSVITIWGEPGDPVVELLHLKPPAEEVGPLELEHDHEHGETTRRDRLDAWIILHRAGPDGIDAHTAAATIYGKPTPSPAEKEKIRRRLEKLVTSGHATRTGAGKRDETTRYLPADNRTTVQGVQQGVQATRNPHDLHETPQTLHTPLHGDPQLHAPLIERGARVAPQAPPNGDMP
jgi:replicative DNA helicase